MATNSLDCGRLFASIRELLIQIKDANLNSAVNGTLLGLTTAIDQLTENPRKRADTLVENEVEDFRQKLKELRSMVHRRFIPSCESVAKYVTKQDRLQRIEDDLRAGNLASLQRFISILKKRLDNYKKGVERFETDFHELKQRVKAQVDKQKELKTDKENKATMRKVVTAAGGGAVIVGALGAASGGLGLVSGYIAYMVFSGGLLIGAAAAGAAGTIDLSIYFTKEEYQLMTLITKGINNVFREMGNLKDDFGHIHDAMVRAEEDLATVVDLEEQPSTADVDSVVEAFEEFRDSMQEVLERIESLNQ